MEADDAGAAGLQAWFKNLFKLPVIVFSAPRVFIIILPPFKVAFPCAVFAASATKYHVPPVPPEAPSSKRIWSRFAEPPLLATSAPKLNSMFPTTSNDDEGEVVPIPTLPELGNG